MINKLLNVIKVYYIVKLHAASLTKGSSESSGKCIWRMQTAHCSGVLPPMLQSSSNSAGLRSGQSKKREHMEPLVQRLAEQIDPVRKCTCTWQWSCICWTWPGVWPGREDCSKSLDIPRPRLSHSISISPLAPGMSSSTQNRQARCLPRFCLPSCSAISAHTSVQFQCQACQQQIWLGLQWSLNHSQPIYIYIYMCTKKSRTPSFSPSLLQFLCFLYVKRVQLEHASQVSPWCTQLLSMRHQFPCQKAAARFTQGTEDHLPWRGGYWAVNNEHSPGPLTPTSYLKPSWIHWRSIVTEVNNCVWLIANDWL